MDIESVEPNEIPEGAYLIDVREQSEWDEGHAPNAHHLPASELLEHLDQLPDEEAYLVCRGGGRSFQVAQWLTANGFEVVNVSGGMGRWIEQDLPIVRDDEGEPRII